MSLESILCDNIGGGGGGGGSFDQSCSPYSAPMVGQTLTPRHHHRDQSIKSHVRLSQRSLPSEINSALAMKTKEHHLDSLKRQYLEEVAEQTYFNFLSDVINLSRSRASTASSLEELAMHRVLSERLSSYFTQPNHTTLLRKEMIQAATMAATADRATTSL
jgi:hypothetical protein